MSVQSGELIRFLRNLRAVRDYTAAPIEDSIVEDILEVGRWAGSSSNKQATEVIVVRDPAVKQQLAEGGVAPAAGAALALVIVTPGDSATREREAFDDGRLVERLLLAAKAHGLGANIGALKGEGPNTIKKALGIPADRRVWSVVTIGHIDEAARKARSAARTSSGRKPMSEFAYWDRYAGK
jgi:nitroreductase